MMDIKTYLTGHLVFELIDFIPLNCQFIIHVS